MLQQKKPRRGDRVLNVLFTNQLDVLSPLRGFRFVDVPVPGVTPPSVFFRTFGAFPRTLILQNLARTKLSVNSFRNVAFSKPLFLLRWHFGT